MNIPKHLKKATQKWVKEISETYELESHHRRLLILAAESWDRCQDAREAIAEHGTIYIDKFQQPKPRPEVAIERDSRIAFARLIRELNLSEGPEEIRPPALKYGSN